MKELSLELSSAKCNENIVVKIDGNVAKLKKNDSGKLICNYQTENDKVNIQVYKLLNVGGFFWFITQLFFFLISIFGLFGTYRKEKCLVIDFEIDVELDELNIVSLQLNNLQKNKKAIEVKTNLVCEEKSNVVVVDKRAKKIIVGLRVAKIILAIATVILIAFLLIEK